MLFNSLAFFIFFCVVYSLYRTVAGWTGRKLVLLTASYFFYAWWNPPFTLLLILSTVVDFFAAKKIAANKHRHIKVICLIVSLFFNLGILAFFKYGNFLAENFALLIQGLGLPWKYVYRPWDIVLPIGISFYTFQSLSYTLDVYRSRLKPTNSFLNFALYVSFFPQLVAGPIVRATDFLWQTENEPDIDSSQFSWGIFLCAWGLFKKVVLADNIGIVVNEIYANTATAGILDSWIATYGFAVQIYCDFSGYSDMAIGLALMLGFHIPDNFLRPYGALGFSDFWRRWHISLSSWLRDYLYISLGGNRYSAFRTHANLMLTMLIGGLWHGARWTFVVWGGLHGLYLICERFFFPFLGIDRNKTDRLPLYQKAVLWFVVTNAVCLAWTFFRAENVSQAVVMIQNMLLLGNDMLLLQERLLRKSAVTMVVLILFLWHFINRDRSLTDITTKLPDAFLGIIAGGLFIFTLLLGGKGAEFIYFQF
jgi:alginate O-acetyltransferase complex protein AlgI